MTSFTNRSTTPILPTRQIYASTRCFNKEDITLEMFVFSHLDSDIVELLVQTAQSAVEYEHVFLSKKAILEQVDDELVARFEVARHNRRDEEESFQTEDEQLDECTNDIVGEFVVDHISIDPKDHSKLLIAPVKNIYEAPMSLTALKPHGRSELNVNRMGIDESSPTSIGDSLLRPPQHHTTIRRPSIVLKAVDAFKQSITHREEHDRHRADMHPAKGRLHKSVKRVMLQNAVAKVRHMLGRPDSSELRPTSASSAERASPARRPSSLETVREEIASRRKEKTP